MTFPVLRVRVLAQRHSLHCPSGHYSKRIMGIMESFPGVGGGGGEGGRGHILTRLSLAYNLIGLSPVRRISYELANK